MAITGTDLIAPKGELDLSLFPGDTEIDLSERLDAFLLEAEGKKAGVSDDGKKAWAYHRAFRQIFIRLSNFPASEVDDQGNVKYSDAQIQNFSTIAEDYKEQWDEIISGTDASSTIATGTGSVDNNPKW
jgi:hypothetical protein